MMCIGPRDLKIFHLMFHSPCNCYGNSNKPRETYYYTNTCKRTHTDTYTSNRKYIDNGDGNLPRENFIDMAQRNRHVLHAD